MSERAAHTRFTRLCMLATGRHVMQEYTGQPVAEAHKYRALMDWLDTQQQHVNGTPAAAAATGSTAPPVRPLCMSVRAAGGAGGGVSGTAGGGGVALGEGVLAGPPAVLLPAAGQVLIMVGCACGIAPCLA